MAKTVTLKDTSTNEVLYPITLAGNIINASGESIDLENIADPTAAINSAITSHNNSSSAHSAAISAHNSNSSAHSTLFNTKADKVAVVNQTAASVAIAPNVFNKWGTVATLSITLAAPSDETIMNEYMFEFKSGSTATTLTLPTSISWMGGNTPTISANKTYQISIVNNLAICAEF